MSSTIGHLESQGEQYHRASGVAGYSWARKEGTRSRRHSKKKAPGVAGWEKRGHSKSQPFLKEGTPSRSLRYKRQNWAPGVAG
jgi:hypothetical protein